MASPSSKIWLYRLLLRANQCSKLGFTLIELLVAIIIAALVVSGLLYLVVEMLQLDRREFVLNQTQQDMQRSLTYINSDLQEAVYVYSTPSTVTDSLNFPADEIPVLAFWRPDAISEADEAALNGMTCSTIADSDDADACGILKIRRHTYSLVVYLLKPNQNGEVWGGEARILRYELPKYSNTVTTAFNETPGYVDPSLSAPPFLTWAPDSTAATIGGSRPVLTDYVDLPTAAVVNLPDCSNFGTDYIRSPESTTGVTSFFTCIRNSADSTTNLASLGQNQDIYVFLRGNALANRPGLINSLNEGSDNPTLQSRVQVRGILEKEPD